MPNQSGEADIDRGKDLLKRSKDKDLPSAAQRQLKAAGERLMNRGASKVSKLGRKKSSRSSIQELI